MANPRSDMPRWRSPVSSRLPKKESSMTCCDAPRMDSRAAIRLDKGSLRERVKALGNKACRASAANSVEQILSANWVKKDLRVNPIFCCHGSSHFLQRFRKYLNKSTSYRDNFILSSRHWIRAGAVHQFFMPCGKLICLDEEAGVKHLGVWPLDDGLGVHHDHVVKLGQFVGAGANL